MCDVPHLTVARVRKGVHKKELLSVVDEFADRTFGMLDVSKVVLYNSVLKPPHPEYQVLYEVRLG